MKQSAYAAKMQEQTRRQVARMQAVMKQYMFDTLVITMHEDFGWGYDRIQTLEKKWGETYNHYSDAISLSDEADVLQELMDNAIRRVTKEQDFYPFAERYPEILRRDYEGRKR